MFTMLAKGPKSISFWKAYGKRETRLKEIYQFLKPLLVASKNSSVRLTEPF